MVLFGVLPYPERSKFLVLFPTPTCVIAYLAFLRLCTRLTALGPLPTLLLRGGGKRSGAEAHRQLRPMSRS